MQKRLVLSRYRNAGYTGSIIMSCLMISWLCSLSGHDQITALSYTACLAEMTQPAGLISVKSDMKH